MNPNIQFTPKNEAGFICPESAYVAFGRFLETNHITILKREEAGESNGERLYMIEVSDVDLAESKQLISKFIKSFEKSS
jgi:hypothetical protein